MAELSPEQFEELAAKFPPRFVQGRSAGKDVSPAEVIEAVFPLGPDQFAEVEAHEREGGTMGVGTPSIKTIRATHHRIARLLALGVKDVQVGAMCNYSQNRICLLKQDPAFLELIEFYKGKVDAEFTDFVRTANDLSLDFLQELGRRLEESPESFTASALMEAIRTLADRTGNGPQSKQVNVNVNMNMGDKLRAMARRVEQARQIGSSSTMDPTDG